MSGPLRPAAGLILGVLMGYLLMGAYVWLTEVLDPDQPGPLLGPSNWQAGGAVYTAGPYALGVLAFGAGALCAAVAGRSGLMAAGLSVLAGMNVWLLFGGHYPPGDISYLATSEGPYVLLAALGGWVSTRPGMPETERAGGQRSVARLLGAFIAGAVLAALLMRYVFSLELGSEPVLLQGALGAAAFMVGALCAAVGGRLHVPLASASYAAGTVAAALVGGSPSISRAVLPDFLDALLSIGVPCTLLAASGAWFVYLLVHARTGRLLAGFAVGLAAVVAVLPAWHPAAFRVLSLIEGAGLRVGGPFGAALSGLVLFGPSLLVTLSAGFLAAWISGYFRVRVAVLCALAGAMLLLVATYGRQEGTPYYLITLYIAPLTSPMVALAALGGWLSGRGGGASG